MGSQEVGSPEHTAYISPFGEGNHNIQLHISSKKCEDASILMCWEREKSDVHAKLLIIGKQSPL